MKAIVLILIILISTTAPQVKSVSLETRLKEAAYLIKTQYDVEGGEAQLTKLAEQGFLKAQWLLADFYERNDYLPIDYNKAIFWHRKAAEQGDELSQMALAIYYDEGIHLEKNEKEAIKWYQKAAKANVNSAQAMLGSLYEHGNLGLEVNNELSFFWYKKAAEQENGSAQYKVGMYYLRGVGVDKNIENAKSWLGRSVHNGIKIEPEEMKVLRDEICTQEPSLC